MPRNAASKLRARRLPSGAVQRLNAATSSAAASRRRRLSDAIAVASVAAAFVCGSFGVSDVYAQRAPARNPAQSNAATKTPLFSGKFARNVSEKFSRDAETQDRGATRRYPQTSERGAVNARSNPSTAPASSANRAPIAQRPLSAPTRTHAPGYNASRSAAPNAPTSAQALAQPSTSRESAQEALAKIPWETLSPAARQKLAELAKNPTMYRRLPMAGGYCNPELFDFFLTHPHAVVGLWRQMGYDDVSMTQIGPNLYSIREKTGTVGRAQILYQDDDLTLVYCNGKYQGPVVPRALDGEMFLVLQTRYTEDPTGRPIVVCRLDAFVDLKNAGADLLARTFSGALGKLADSNFEQTLAFIDSVSQTAETNPGSLSASIVGLSELSPEARRLFAAKTSETARQAQLRARGTYVDYRLLPKLNNPTPTVARVLSRERTGATNASIAARSPNAASFPASAALPGTEYRSATRETFAADATTARAGSASSRSSTLGADASSGLPFNDFDKPSLERNSFALSDDSASDYDFEAELDWEEDEEPLKVGGARVAPQSSPAREIASAPLVPETSVAKVTARPATRFSDALDLVEPSATVDVSDGYNLSDGSATLATEDEPIVQNDAPLLLDFETELLEEANADEDAVFNDAASTVAKPAPLVAFPTANAADAIALPGLTTAAATDDSPELPTLVFDEATNETSPNETSAGDDLPLLFLPGDDATDATQSSAPPTKVAPQPVPQVALNPGLTTPKARGRVGAPIVPNPKKAKKPANAQPTQPSPTPPKSAPTVDAPQPVWRAVEPKPAQTTPQVAPPSAKTARAATDKGGATFRKPEIH